MNEDQYLSATAKKGRRSTTTDLSRQLPTEMGTTIPRQFVYILLGHICSCVIMSAMFLSSCLTVASKLPKDCSVAIYHPIQSINCDKVFEAVRATVSVHAIQSLIDSILTHAIAVIAVQDGYSGYSFS
ncbi:hypothetical protein TNCV_892241 [Trichonephila clavipes]|nr:hypothetical protein TNCV_892241 [Trichonephila clavipes]